MALVRAVRVTPADGAVVNVRRIFRTVSGGRRKALRAARMLDQVVDEQVGGVPRLPERSRERAARHLAELVLLAHAYRRYAAGWLSRSQLRRRGRRTVRRLDSLRRPRMEQLTERE